MSLWRSAPISLLVAAFCAVPAAASAPAIGTPEFDQLVQVATGHWPATPCGGAVEYGYADLPGTTVGYASWMQPAVESPDPATFSSCRIDLEAGLEVEPATLCTVIAHELGHLLGLGHVDDPADVMHANLRGSLVECAAAFPAAPEPEAAATVVADDQPAAAPAPKPRRARRARGKRRHGARRAGRAAHRASARPRAGSH
jgi:hypothetical protein